MCSTIIMKRYSKWNSQYESNTAIDIQHWNNEDKNKFRISTGQALFSQSMK